MNFPTIIKDSKGFFISIDDQPPIYLKDKQGNITQDRIPWIDKFLGVNIDEQGYKILCRLKNGKLAIWTVNTSGIKQARQLLDSTDLISIAQNFNLDPSLLSSADINTKTIHAKPEKLIIHCGYHKVATIFFAKIFKNIAKELGWKFQSCKQEDLDPETNIFLQHHTKVNLSALPPYIGSHIRDPRDMIISGYFYHLWTTEKWCHRPKPQYKNCSYQEVLNTVSQEEGIVMEMERMKGAIKNMIAWDYANPNFIEIRLEDLSKNEKQVFEEVFHHYGFNRFEMETALSIVDKLSFEKRSGREKGKEDKKSHFRKGVSGDWQNYFTLEHKELFKKQYPAALEKLGYELDDNW